MLFNDKEELLIYQNVASNFDFDVLKPFIEESERSYLIPFIGKAQFLELESAYLASIDEDEPVTLVEKFQNLLHYCRRPVSALAMYLAAADLAVQVNQNGIRRLEDETSRTAYQYQETNWKSSKLKIGLGQIDDLGDWLDENLDDFPTYAGSVEYTANKEYFLFSAGKFSEHFNINRSRWTFNALKPFMKRIQNHEIKAAIGETKFNELLAEITTGETPGNADLMFKVREAVAHLAISKAVLQLSLNIDHNGVTAVESGSKTTETKKPVNDSRLVALKHESENTGLFFLEQAQRVIQPEADGTNYSVDNEGIEGGFLAL
jgi:hypothetical protein